MTELTPKILQSYKVFFTDEPPEWISWDYYVDLVCLILENVRNTQKLTKTLTAPGVSIGVRCCWLTLKEECCTYNNGRMAF